MKLRNKKTGKIWHMPRLRQPTVQEDDISFFACIGEHGCSRGELFSYKSLAELNEEWEDYKPAEPLIKDEKIRKAVRAWAEAIDYRIDNLLCIKTSGNTRLEISDGSPKLIYISLFVDKGTLANIKDRTYYTIDELCGEEEE